MKGKYKCPALHIVHFNFILASELHVTLMYSFPLVESVFRKFS
jgi:hypothetical protein